jgi:signal transduction histidine kinase
MADTPNFDIQQAHTYFSSDCFNRTWDNMEKDGSRSTEENMEMLHTAIASIWHWSQRKDVTCENLSVGYWQVSRVYCLIGQPNNARRYGMLALQYAKDLPPFFKGYAYEALARAEMIADKRVIMLTHLEKARETLALVEDEEERQRLANDLRTIR